MGLIDKLVPAFFGGFAIGGALWVAGLVVDKAFAIPDLAMPLLGAGFFLGVAYGLFKKEK